MKKKPALLTFILLILTTLLYSQDYIIRVEPVIEPQLCDQPAIQNDTLTFTTPSDGENHTRALADLFGIRFQADHPDELLFLNYRFHTITGVVETINPRNILYRDEYNLLHTIDINDVFCIYFDESNNHKYDDSLYANYVNIHKYGYTNNSKLIRKDSSVLHIQSDVNLQQDTLRISIPTGRKKPLNTYADVNTLSTYIHKEPADRLYRNSFNNYLFNHDGDYVKVKGLRIQKNELYYTGTEKRNEDEVMVSKNEVIGIYFDHYNFNKEEPPVIPEEELVVEEIVKEKMVRDTFLLENVKYTVDFALGFGNMLATDNSFDFMNVSDAYKSRLKRGFTIDMNMRVFVSKDYGVGLKYNHFYTNESYYESLTEKINIKFLGATLFGKIPVNYSRWLFNVDLSIGFITRSEHFIISKKQYYISGTAPGIYASGALEYFISDKVSAGVSLGFMGGYLESPSINTDYEYNNVLGKSHSLGRLDALVRIKAYL